MAVVGARRVRQGTGEYVARELAAQGCQVTAVLGTRPDSAEQARAGLAERHGLAVRAYSELARLLDEEELQALAICSPSRHHLEALEPALERGLHVFCEKPLHWSPEFEGPDGVARAAALGARLFELARRRGASLVLNCQWPFTLDSFDALYPGVRDEPLRELTLSLAPDSMGPEQLVDSGSHLLSLLYALAGPGQLARIELTRRSPERGLLTARYAPRSGGPEVRAQLELARSPTVPRPASYTINGRILRREIENPGYRFHFASAERRVAARDPLAASVEHFVAAARAGRPPDQTEVVDGLRQLAQLVWAGTAAPAPAVSSGGRDV